MTGPAHGGRLRVRVLAGLLAGGAITLASAQEIATYEGPCDASAAVALDADRFVVGNDENNILHIYQRGQPAPTDTVDLTRFLDVRGNQEADIEAGAVIGTRAYWITSHGRNRAGKARPGRQRIFATDLRPGSAVPIEPVGKPYTQLLRDLEETPSLKPYRLGDAARLAAEAPGGLNIEGLAATPDGKLLIGLRNPVPGQRALIVPLDNPAEVIEGKRAKLGAPVELDLGDRGIRSIELVGAEYVIVAGPAADVGTFVLYRWSGRPGDAATPVPAAKLGTLRPEALFAVPQSARVQLLSDDGGVRAAGVECKALPKQRQSFRSLTIDR
ncbi:MAG: DUF3616 domain-containing protein [Betaproteobacteria bacterium]